MGRVRALGLFPERLDSSPYDIAHDGTGVQRPADADFWARLSWAVSTGRAAILEEHHVGNASRRHRLTRDNIDAVRSRLAPRALLTVWPDLSTDVTALLASLTGDGMVELVWEDHDGRITSAIADTDTDTGEAEDEDTDEAEDRSAGVLAQVAAARAATVLPLDADARHPLFTAALPDSDGVVRSRWRTEPTPSDRDWAFLKTLRRGQIVTGTVTEIADSGVTFVEIGGFTAMIDITELSWRHIDHPCDAVTLGERITAEVLDVDMVRERVPLSLKSLQPDPLPSIAERIGRTVTDPEQPGARVVIDRVAAPKLE